MTHIEASTADRDAFELAIIAFQEGRINREQLAEESYPTLRRFARVAAHELDIEDEAEDVVQALWIMFINRIAPEYDPSKSVYPYLTTFARNLARNAKWQRKATPQLPVVHDEHDEETLADRHGVMWRDDDVPIDDQVARNAALRKVSALLGGGRANPAYNHGLMPGVELVAKAPGSPSQASQPRTKRVLSADQQELVQIRNKLGMTQPEFALLLNINVPRLSSWEYGRTKGVPKYYMDLARQMLKEGNRPYEDGTRRFGDKSMSEILAQWARTLGVDEDDTYTLARIMKVSEPTIRRWRNNEVKPSITSLNQYQAIVDKFKRV